MTMSVCNGVVLSAYKKGMCRTNEFNGGACLFVKAIITNWSCADK